MKLPLALLLLLRLMVDHCANVDDEQERGATRDNFIFIYSPSSTRFIPSFVWFLSLSEVLPSLIFDPFSYAKGDPSDGTRAARHPRRRL